MTASKVLFYFCLSFISGIFLSSILEISQLTILGLLILGVFLISVFWKYKKPVTVGFCLLILVTGVWRYQQAELKIINDELSRTLVTASDLEIKKIKNSAKNKQEIAEAVGQKIAEKAKDAKITKVVFDRGGFKFHGRVKALAERAKKAGLIF